MYHNNTKTQVSANGSTWVTVFDSAVWGEYTKTLAGKTHTFTQQNVRYVRDYLNGSMVNPQNHWTEIEVWGTTTTAYVGDYYEWNGSASTMVKYYYAGTTRVAMRAGSGTGTTGLNWLLGDHLGSTAITADASGNKLAELRYKAWGETRYTYGTTPTKRQFTGQISEMASIGLYFYEARFYDPVLSRFTSADSIIPGAGDAQAWDRYQYVRSNPIKYTDPSGHMVDDGDDSGCDATCWDRTRQNHLFSLIYRGSGESGIWTGEDWKYYHENRENLWAGMMPWKNQDIESGWDLFALHTARLASAYDAAQTDQFMRDFALIFGGISATDPMVKAIWDARHGPSLPFLNEGNRGLSSQYIDSNAPATNQSHHYAGILFLSYFTGAGPGAIVNLARDPDNPGDINLGLEAARHSAYLLGPVWNSTFYDLSTWIDDLSP